MTKVSKPLQVELRYRNPDRSLAAWVGRALATVSLKVLFTLSLL